MEEKNHKLSNIELKCYDLEFLAVFKHFIWTYIQKFNIGPILFWFFSGPHAARGPQIGKPWAGRYAFLQASKYIFLTIAVILQTKKTQT